MQQLFVDALLKNIIESPITVNTLCTRKL